MEEDDPGGNEADCSSPAAPGGDDTGSNNSPVRSESAASPENNEDRADSRRSGSAASETRPDSPTSEAGSNTAGPRSPVSDAGSETRPRTPNSDAGSSDNRSKSRQSATADDESNVATDRGSGSDHQPNSPASNANSEVGINQSPASQGSRVESRASDVGSERSRASQVDSETRAESPASEAGSEARADSRINSPAASNAGSGSRPASPASNAGSGSRPASRASNAGSGSRPASPASNAGSGSRPASPASNAGSGSSRPASRASNAGSGSRPASPASNAGSDSRPASRASNAGSGSRPASRASIVEGGSRSASRASSVDRGESPNSGAAEVVESRMESRASDVTGEARSESRVSDAGSDIGMASDASAAGHDRRAASRISSHAESAASDGVGKVTSDEVEEKRVDDAAPDPLSPRVILGNLFDGIVARNLNGISGDQLTTIGPKNLPPLVVVESCGRLVVWMKVDPRARLSEHDISNAQDMLTRNIIRERGFVVRKATPVQQPAAKAKRKRSVVAKETKKAPIRESKTPAKRAKRVDSGASAKMNQSSGQFKSKTFISDSNSSDSDAPPPPVKAGSALSRLASELLSDHSSAATDRRKSGQKKVVDSSSEPESDGRARRKSYTKPSKKKLNAAAKIKQRDSSSSADESDTKDRLTRKKKMKHVGRKVATTPATTTSNERSNSADTNQKVVDSREKSVSDVRQRLSSTISSKLVINLNKIDAPLATKPASDATSRLVTDKNKLFDSSDESDRDNVREKASLVWRPALADISDGASNDSSGRKGSDRKSKQKSSQNKKHAISARSSSPSSSSEEDVTPQRKKNRQEATNKRKSEQSSSVIAHSASHQLTADKKARDKSAESEKMLPNVNHVDGEPIVEDSLRDDQPIGDVSGGAPDKISSEETGATLSTSLVRRRSTSVANSENADCDTSSKTNTDTADAKENGENMSTAVSNKFSSSVVPKDSKTTDVCLNGEVLTSTTPSLGVADESGGASVKQRPSDNAEIKIDAPVKTKDVVTKDIAAKSDSSPAKPKEKRHRKHDGKSNSRDRNSRVSDKEDDGTDVSEVRRDSSSKIKHGGKLGKSSHADDTTEDEPSRKKKNKSHHHHHHHHHHRSKHGNRSPSSARSPATESSTTATKVKPKPPEPPDHSGARALWKNIQLKISRSDAEATARFRKEQRARRRAARLARNGGIEEAGEEEDDDAYEKLGMTCLAVVSRLEPSVIEKWCRKRHKSSSANTTITTTSKRSKSPPQPLPSRSISREKKKPKVLSRLRVISDDSSSDSAIPPPPRQKSPTPPQPPPTPTTTKRVPDSVKSKTGETKKSSTKPAKQKLPPDTGSSKDRQSTKSPPKKQSTDSSGKSTKKRVSSPATDTSASKSGKRPEDKSNDRSGKKKTSTDVSKPAKLKWPTTAPENSKTTVETATSASKPEVTASELDSPAKRTSAERLPSTELPLQGFEDGSLLSEEDGSFGLVNNDEVLEHARKVGPQVEGSSGEDECRHHRSPTDSELLFDPLGESAGWEDLKAGDLCATLDDEDGLSGESAVSGELFDATHDHMLNNPFRRGFCLDGKVEEENDSARGFTFDDLGEYGDYLNDCDFNGSDRDEAATIESITPIKSFPNVGATDAGSLDGSVGRRSHSPRSALVVPFAQVNDTSLTSNGGGSWDEQNVATAHREGEGEGEEDDESYDRDRSRHRRRARTPSPSSRDRWRRGAIDDESRDAWDEEEQEEERRKRGRRRRREDSPDRCRRRSRFDRDDSPERRARRSRSPYRRDSWRRRTPTPPAVVVAPAVNRSKVARTLEFASSPTAEVDTEIDVLGDRRYQEPAARGSGTVHRFCALERMSLRACKSVCEETLSVFAPSVNDESVLAVGVVNATPGLVFSFPEVRVKLEPTETRVLEAFSATAMTLAEDIVRLQPADFEIASSGGEEAPVFQVLANQSFLPDRSNANFHATLMSALRGGLDEEDKTAEEQAVPPLPIDKVIASVISDVVDGSAGAEDEDPIAELDCEPPIRNFTLPGLMIRFEDEVRKSNLENCVAIYYHLCPKIAAEIRLDLLENMLNVSKEKRRVDQSIGNFILQTAVTNIPHSANIPKQASLMIKTLSIAKKCEENPVFNHKNPSKLTLESWSLNAIYNCVLLEALNRGMAEVVHLFRFGLEVGLLLSSELVRGLLHAFHAQGMLDWAREAYRIGLSTGVYTRVKVRDWPTVLNIKSYYSESEMTTILADFLPKYCEYIRNADFGTQKIRREEKYTIYVNIEVMEDHDAKRVTSLCDIDWSLNGATTRMATSCGTCQLEFFARADMPIRKIGHRSVLQYLDHGSMLDSRTECPRFQEHEFKRAPSHHIFRTNVFHGRYHHPQPPAPPPAEAPR